MVFDVVKAQEEFTREYSNLRNSVEGIDDTQEAILFAKILLKQKTYTNENIIFCSDNEFYVAKNPAGFAITGYYTLGCSSKKIPFNITVCKYHGLWYPSKEYVAADTKSCSGSILIWILLSLGCTLMGILMYFLISAAIGI